MKTTIIAALVSLCFCASMSAADTVKSVWVGDRYFELVPWTGTWDAAKADAESKGGRLACIKDATTNNSIFNNLVKGGSIKTIYWGGYLIDGKWSLIDGTIMQYKNWNPGQPNDKSGAIAFQPNPLRPTWNNVPTNHVYPNSGYILELTREQYNTRNAKIALPAPMPAIRPTPATASTQTTPGHI